MKAKYTRIDTIDTGTRSIINQYILHLMNDCIKPPTDELKIIKTRIDMKTKPAYQLTTF
jgi:hypothetical protein